jgi:Holliday junction resolvasome RuvABC ATP-dependent DNA helicase subunit
MKLGFLERTPRGRVVTLEAKKYLKIGGGIFQEKLVE